MTPSIHIEKYDVASGEQAGDRDDVKDALKMAGDGQQIAFKITNTSKTDSSTGESTWYLAKDLKMVDRTIAGEGDVTDWKYPDDWDTLVLKPGESTIITGTLKGVEQGGKHTDRVKVTGTPLVECPVTDQFGGQQTTDGNQTGDEKSDADTKVDGDVVRHDRPQAGQGRRQDPMRGHHRGLEHRRLELSPRYTPRPAWPSAALLLSFIAFGGVGVTLLGARRRTSTVKHGVHAAK